MIAASASFLIVDDDTTFRTRLARAISSRGFQVTDSGSPENAIELARIEKPSHVILDLRMPKLSGLDVLRELKRMDEGIKILILTGYGSIATALEAVRAGAINYLTKPTDLDAILDAFSAKPSKPISAPITPSLSRVEWEHIERVMQECDGNISQTAKKLGLHRRSLQRKLKNPPSD